MRTNLIRALMAVAMLLACAAAPAFAQSVMRGKVVDAQGQPVDGATVLFEAQGVNRQTSTKTDKKGEYLQVGLSSGEYKITVSKDGVGTQTLTGRVSQGQNPPMSFTLKPAAAPGSGIAAADKAAAAALGALANAATEHLKAGRNDEAIAAFTDLTVKVPTCADCYYNLGTAYLNKKDYANAETAFKKVIELKPDSAEAYTGLANIYNTQKKFDLAAEASANASKYAGGPAGAAGGGSAEASYNQGVILFNGGKFTEAKAQFESAVKADPNMALAHYQLGMTALNLGDFNLAVSSLEKYLQLDPNGPKAAEVKASLPALQSMVKK